MGIAGIAWERMPTPHEAMPRHILPNNLFKQYLTHMSKWLVQRAYSEKIGDVMENIGSTDGEKFES